MSSVRLAFERNGAHALALLGALVGTALLVYRRWLLGLTVLTAVAWAYVLGYLWYAWVRFAAKRRERDWSSGEQFVALGALIARDSRVGTAPVPVLVAGLLGMGSTLLLVLSTRLVVVLPAWVVLGLSVPTVVLLLPVGIGAAGRRAQRYGDVVDLKEE
ncbi:MAG: hypothetical protein ABEJ61_01325 [Haloferacaceae archaeon]